MRISSRTRARLRRRAKARAEWRGTEWYDEMQDLVAEHVNRKRRKR